MTKVQKEGRDELSSGLTSRRTDIDSSAFQSSLSKQEHIIPLNSICTSALGSFDTENNQLQFHIPALTLDQTWVIRPRPLLV